MSEFVTWEFKDPTPEELLQASDMADVLSEAAFIEDLDLAREHAKSIVQLLWPPTT